MVDFAKHLKRKEKPTITTDLVGTLTSWTLPIGGDPRDAVQKECTYRVSKYKTPYLEWTSFSLTAGGVTDYESFILEEQGVLMMRTLGRFGNSEGSWSCCAGTKGGWHQQRIDHSEIRPILERWLTSRGLIIRVCMHCWKGLETISAQGKQGGWSHTICDDCRLSF